MKPASTNLETPAGPQAPSEHPAAMPVWLQRLFLIVYVAFCAELGFALIALPWTGWWFTNSLLLHWPSLNRIFQSGFVRGAVSGLGFLDLWLGISAVAHHRDAR